MNRRQINRRQINRRRNRRRNALLLIGAMLLIAVVVIVAAVQLAFHLKLFNRNGWQESDTGIVRYLDERGEALTGWQEIEGNKYYFDPSQDGAMLTGWQQLNGARYFFSEKGVMATGWLETDKGRFYLTETGTMATGWLSLDEGRYYLNENGNPISGWTSIEDNRYFFDKNGVMATGWLEYEGDRYFLRQDGRMAVGEQKIDGVSYFFTSKGKQVLIVNRWNPVPEDYEVDLVAFHGYKMAASCAEELDTLLAACKKAGYSYSINSVYRDLTDQQEIWDSRYNNYVKQGYSSEKANELVSMSVAVPGTSEHHLGLAADVGGSSKMYEWMREHSWEYGFIVRYPEGKTEYTGIIHEPWHLRYVGTELAKELYDLDLCMEEYMQMLTKNS